MQTKLTKPEVEVLARLSSWGGQREPVHWLKTYLREQHSIPIWFFNWKVLSIPTQRVNYDEVLKGLKKKRLIEENPQWHEEIRITRQGHQALRNLGYAYK